MVFEINKDDTYILGGEAEKSFFFFLTTPSAKYIANKIYFIQVHFFLKIWSVFGFIC